MKTRYQRLFASALLASVLAACSSTPVAFELPVRKRGHAVAAHVHGDMPQTLEIGRSERAGERGILIPAHYHLPFLAQQLRRLVRI